jgi:hypothetical protein
MEVAKSLDSCPLPAFGNCADEIYPFSLFPSIPHLLAARCPAAVPRFVVAIIVDTVQRMNFGWALSHIDQEIRKRVPPTLADNNSASAITMVHRLAGIPAPAIHIEPCSIFRRLFVLAFGESMFVEHNYIVPQKVA